MHAIGVRVYMAEQSPSIQAYDVVPHNYEQYLALEKKHKSATQARGADQHQTENDDLDGGDPTGADGSLGWAALWKVTKVLPFHIPPLTVVYSFQMYGAWGEIVYCDAPSANSIP